MKIKKIILGSTFMLCSFVAISQSVGINDSGSAPDPSAGLDIDFSNKGILIPRVNLQSTTDVSTIANPVTSLLVYNTNSGMTGGAEGFWYYDGAQWTPMKPVGAATVTSDPTLIYTTGGF